MVAQLGLVKVLGLPQDFCFKGTAADILQLIASYLAVELPESITNVVVGNSEPTDIQNTALWIRQNASGTFQGLYVVSGGQWVPIYPVPGQLTWVYGSTDDVPEGWQRADQDPLVPSATQAFLITQWYENPDNPGEYLVYQVTPDF